MPDSSVLNQLGNAIGKATGALAAIAVLQKIAVIPKTVETGVMMFPADLTPSYRFTMDFYQYSRESLLSIGNLGSVGQITLPIPTNLSDSFNVTYETESVGTALGAGVEGLASSGFGAGAADAAKGYVASAALRDSTFGALASAFMGQTANPFMTVLFKSPNYKEYSFSWRLFPRNQLESNRIIDIVNAVKYHMLPSYVGGMGGSVFTYPSLIKCAVFSKGGPIYPFKYGVIKNATFNYAPDGTPSFHKDGRPSAVDLKIDMQEVEYFIRDDTPFGAGAPTP